VDEWGIMRLPASRRDGSEGLVPQGQKRTSGLNQHNLEDALGTALHLNAFIRHSRSVRMANFPPMPMSLGSTLCVPKARFCCKQHSNPFELYNHTCGQLALDVLWYGDTFSGTYKDRTYSGIRTLNVAATLDERLKQVVVYVVNQVKQIRWKLLFP